MNNSTKYFTIFTNIKILIILFFITSFNLTAQNVIEHTWQVYNYEVENNHLPDSDEVETIQNFNRAIFRFYPNGKLVALLTERGYFVGKWSKGEGNKYYIMKGGFLINPLKIKIQSVQKDYTQFVILNKQNKPTNLSLMMMISDEWYNVGNVDYLEDSDMNKWRIKPLTSENEILLKKRCFEMLSFAINYLEMSVQNRRKTSGTNLMQLPFEMIDGRFLLRSMNDLPQRWVNIFYNSTDAVNAYKILSESIKTVNYNSTIESDNYELKNKSYLKVLSEVRNNLHYKIESTEDR